MLLGGGVLGLVLARSALVVVVLAHLSSLLALGDSKRETLHCPAFGEVVPVGLDGTRTICPGQAR